MKKFRITYYDIDGYLDDEIIECNDLKCAEEQANNTLEKKIERANENYEAFLRPSYSIEEIR